jgi:hypothetical protein
MFAALDLASRAAVGVGLVLASAWLATQSLRVVLRRRGPIWQIPASRRNRRVSEAYAFAVALALLAAALAGWLGRILGVPFWIGAAVAAAVSLWATLRVAKVFGRCGRWVRS